MSDALEPLYPVAHHGPDDPAGEPGMLPVPSAQAQRLMAAHLREHGTTGFRVELHVRLGGPAEAGQLLVWNPVKASFTCDRCPGKVFLSGEITEEAVHSAQRWDQGLAPHLVGLIDNADRDEMTRRYLDGTLNRERLRQARGADALRRNASGARPAVAERRRRVQAWLLERYRANGVLERVLEEADRLDLDGWLRMSDRRLSRETLRDYWQDIPQAERDAARAAWQLAREKST